MFCFQWERATPCTTEQIHIARIFFFIFWWNSSSADFWIYMEFFGGFYYILCPPCADLIVAVYSLKREFEKLLLQFFDFSWDGVSIL